MFELKISIIGLLFSKVIESFFTFYVAKFNVVNKMSKRNKNGKLQLMANIDNKNEKKVTKTMKCNEEGLQKNSSQS